MDTNPTQITIQRHQDGDVVLTMPGAMFQQFEALVFELADGLTRAKQPEQSFNPPLRPPLYIQVSPRMRVRHKEMAEQLGVSVRTLAHWMSRHVVPYEKIGRTVVFDPVAVDKALQRFRRVEIGDPGYRKRRMGRINPAL